MNLALWLRQAALRTPEAPAVAVGSATVHNYGELGRRAAIFAGNLRASLHLGDGDRVAIVAKNLPEYMEILFGIWHSGLAAVPVNAKLHGAEIGWILEHSGCRAAFVSDGIDSALAGHVPDNINDVITIGRPEYQRLLNGDAVAVAERHPDDLAWLFYTSGTTGRPKGAMLTHRNLLMASYAYLTEVDPTEPTDALMHGAPLSHGSGIYMIGHVARGALNIVGQSGGFETDEIIDVFQSRANTSMFAAPTMIKRLVETGRDFDPAAIRTLIWGGAPMHVADTQRALERFGPRLAQIYGQGESPMTITYLSRAEIADSDHPDWLARLGSAGTAYACVDVRVADAEGMPVPQGEAGEILVRGDTVMSGYWNNAEATAASLRDGWLYTGDVGAFDAAGYLSLKDRSKDMIISGGSNIYPREVEEVLLRHDKVQEVSVIGRPHPEWGEVVVAYVVGEATPGELDELCLNAIARFKRPKAYIHIPSLPKNNYGKILKTELRELDAETTGQKGA